MDTTNSRPLQTWWPKNVITNRRSSRCRLSGELSQPTDLLRTNTRFQIQESSKTNTGRKLNKQTQFQCDLHCKPRPVHGQTQCSFRHCPTQFPGIWQKTICRFHFALEENLPIYPGIYIVGSEGLRLQVAIWGQKRRGLAFEKIF